MSKAIRKDKIEIYGNGNNKKDYIYINDCVDILFRLYNMNLWNEIYNIGSGELLSINQIINEIKKIKPDVDYSYIEKKKLDVQSFSLDLTKLLCKLSSYKFTPFKKGIIETYNWEKSKL
jgi:UDP-glucose 4-epimerase